MMWPDSQITVLNDFLFKRISRGYTVNFRETDAFHEMDNIPRKPDFAHDCLCCRVLILPIFLAIFSFDRLPILEPLGLCKFWEHRKIEFQDIAHVVEEARENHVVLVDWFRTPLPQ